MAKRSSSAYSRAGRKHIHREDAFTRIVEKVSHYYVKSPVQATITTIAAIGIIVLIPIVISNWTGRGKKAAPTQAALGLLNVQQLTQQNPQVAEDSLRHLIQTYPRSMPGQKAHYYLGELLYSQQRFTEAREQYAQFEELYSVKKSFLKPAAFYAQANCLEEEGNLSEAVNTYLKLPEKYPESSFIPFAKLGAARCMILSNRLDEATEILEAMLDEYPENDYKIIYRKIEGKLGKIEALQNRF
ncbi:tetratricopeptide repeat protein [candidate division WOR-3 bacterium]|uniref:Tetratricopeptide repeat protein n=1 Tax=candidate division WOR-3 bacterium TaxID=2052148 RepID=A0A9D5K948_UNCW3|nr:tetratricopeptide repeat protein [candidate division WOR-3 bacterium]MBD3363859.1 tetratricopeptide repeat protein [candidate division WOR-3 bacterium]